MPRFKSTFAKLIILVLIAFLVGNSRNPIYDCIDKKEGDPCSSGYQCAQSGTCTLIKLKDCHEGRDECLLCR